MEDKRIKILRDMDTSKAIRKLAIPAIIGFMVLAIYNVADTIFVSWWSYKGAAAIQVIFPIMMISSAIGLMFGIGGGSYISRLLGQGDIDKARSVVITSLLTAIFVGVIYVSICLIWLEELVKIFGASGDIVKLSVEYGFYIILGSFFVIQSMVLNNTLRAEGSAKFSTIGMGIGSVLNIILDPIFIFVFDLGLRGAAIATMLSQGVSFFVLFQFYFRKKTILSVNLKYFRFYSKIYREIFKIGLPTFFRQLLFSISMALLNQVSNRYGGDFLLSAMGIAIKFTSMLGFFIFGMGQGIQPVVGYNYGAKNRDRVFSAQRQGIIKTFRATLIGVVLFIFLAKPIMLLFTKEAEVVKYGISAIRVLSVAALFMSVSNTISVIFQAIGHGWASLLFSVLRQGIILIPAIIFLPKFWGTTGVIYSQFATDLLTFLISLAVYIPFLKNKMEKRLNSSVS